MRRFPALLVSALAATSLITATAQGVSAAPGDATVKTAGMVAPSAVPNAQILRIVRVNKTSSFLVAGIDSTTAGANMYLWKLKEDLTLDTSFTPVDLGNDFEYPTASNSSCIANTNQNNQAGSCYRIESFVINETADSYAISFRRSLTASNNTTDLTAIAIGNLTTGAVSAKSNVFSYAGTTDYSTAFAAYNPSDPVGNSCKTAFGNTFQSVAYSNSYMDTYSLGIRPDSSIMISVKCVYSASTGTPPNVSMTEYTNVGYLALKPSGSALVVDTAWGTNGFAKIFDDPTKCAQTWGGNTLDTSITSNSSTKIYTVALLQLYPRVTTYPFGNSVTTYNGCATSGMAAYSSTILTALTASGKATASTTFNPYISPARWIIDASGRWTNTLMVGAGPTASTSLLRLTTKGEPDTSLGTNGQKTLTGLPATVTVNGSSVQMRYFFSGVATTASTTLFTGFSSTSTMGSGMINCSQPTNYETTTYPYYMTLESGLLTTYGTSGLGQGVTTQFSTADSCSGGNSSISFVNSKGQHAILQVTRAIGSQTAGLKLAVWAAAAGVTSGGDGTGIIGGSSSAGRTDTKVYSTRLPLSVQPNSALTVLTASQAKTLSVRTNTPQVCVGTTNSVLMLDTGRCSVRIVNTATNDVVRRLVTTVKKTDVAEGSIVTTSTPIMFKQAKTGLSKAAQAQVAALVSSATDAGRIVIVGHSAALGDTSPYTYAISRNRALAVKAAMVKAGVKTPIDIVAMGYSKPAKTSKTEAAQAKNRRVEVYIVPK